MMSTEKCSLEADYNFFRIIESADKEMIHSAMVKFFLETYWKEPMLACFNIESLVDEKPAITLEEGHAFEQKTGDRKKVKIRFDIVGRVGNNIQPDFIIENKFKAMPTVAQLESYDQGIETILRNKKDGPKEVVKVLMVFSAQQISETLKQYLCSKNWNVVSYLNVADKDKDLSVAGQTKEIKSFLCTLNEFKRIQPPGDADLKYILESYLNRLEVYDKLIISIVNNPNYLHYNSKNGGLSFMGDDLPTNGLASRFIYLQYLLSIQKEIDKGVKQSSDPAIGGYTLTNNGGSQVIPSIAFWFNVTKDQSARIPTLYFGIDGMTAKIGFCYARSAGYLIENENVFQFIKNYIVRKLANIKRPPKLPGFDIKGSSNRKKIKPAKDNGDTGYPVYAPFCFPLDGVLNREELVNDVIAIIQGLFTSDFLNGFHNDINKYIDEYLSSGLSIHSSD